MSRKIKTARDWDNASIDDFVNDTGIVWKKQDASRSMIDIWLRVVQHAAGFGEQVRRQRLDEATKQLARLAIWMLTFASKGLEKNRSGVDGLIKLTKPVSRLLWMKFPNCCPACFTRMHRSNLVDGLNAKKPRSCRCILTLEETEKRNEVWTSKQKAETKKIRRQWAEAHFINCDYGKISMIELESRFGNIFQRNIFSQSLESMAFHLLEEVGEMAESIVSLYTYQAQRPSQTSWLERVSELEEELADCFSWLFAVSRKFQNVFEVFDNYLENKTTVSKNMFIANHIRDRHRHNASKQLCCFDCQAAECTCKINIIQDDLAANRIMAAPRPAEKAKKIARST